MIVETQSVKSPDRITDLDNLKRSSGESQGKLVWRKLRRNPLAMAGLIGLFFLVLLAVFAPLISPFPPQKIDSTSLLQPPNAAHWFGTDDLGRDIFSRVMWGGRESLRVGLLGISIALVGGTLIGLISGYFGGTLDAFVMRIVDILLSFPTILLLLSIVAALGPSLGTVLIALGISAIPGYSRLVRGSVLAAKHYEYIQATRALGGSGLRIMFDHILPNIIAPVIIYATVGLGSAIMITAGLSYIGLGAQPPSSEWGAMLNYGRGFLRSAWWMSVFPGMAIFTAVLCVNLLGDGLREALDPRMSRIFKKRK